MRRNSRLSDLLHVLLHMAEHDRPVTSAVLAKAMSSNPVIVRRIMAGLREQGYVRSEKGHGGGWELACDLAKITLYDVYDAVGRPSLFAVRNRAEAPDCLVEQTVNAALDCAFGDAEELLLSRLRGVTLGTLSVDFHARLAAGQGSSRMEIANAH